MQTKNKLQFFSYGVFLGIFSLIFLLLYYIFPNLDTSYKALICGGLTTILSPKTHTYKTQSGKKMQFRWIFYQKVITI